MSYFRKMRPFYVNGVQITVDLTVEEGLELLERIELMQEMDGREALRAYIQARYEFHPILYYYFHIYFHKMQHFPE